jgi:hypothetical protein
MQDTRNLPVVPNVNATLPTPISQQSQVQPPIPGP